MAGRGRGSYCMENSIFYNHVLRALGFNVYMVGVKTRLRNPEKGIPSGDYIGQYMIDTAVGGDGAILRIPVDPSTNPPALQNLGKQQVRLLHTHLPFHTSLSFPKRWVYQYRNDSAAEWNDFYAFSAEVEWTPEDFEVVNRFTSNSPRSFQTTTPLVVKFLRGTAQRDPGAVVADGVPGSGSEEVELAMGNGNVVEPPAAAVARAIAACGEKIIGRVMLSKGVVKRNIGGRTEMVQECRTEAARVEALEKWFGIRLTEEERDGIRGTPACLAAWNDM